MKDLPGAGKPSVFRRKSSNTDWRDRPVSIHATIEAKEQLKGSDLSVPLPAPCPIGTAVSTVPVATLVPSLIICTDCLRPQRDFYPHTS